MGVLFNIPWCDISSVFGNIQTVENRCLFLYFYCGSVGYFGIIAHNLYIKMKTPMAENYYWVGY